MESSTKEVYHIWGGKFMSNHGVSYRAAYVDGGTVVALFVGIPVIVENAHSTHPKHPSVSPIHTYVRVGFCITPCTMHLPWWGIGASEEVG